MSLGKRLKDVRKYLGISQKELADVIGVHPQRISDIERGVVKNMKGQEISKLNEEYDIDPSWLSLGKGNMLKNNTIVGVNNGNMHIGTINYPNEIIEIADYLYHNIVPAQYPTVFKAIKDLKDKK